MYPRLPALSCAVLAAVFSPALQADEHAHHHHAASALSRSEVAYSSPRVSLRSQDGATLAFTDAIDDGRPVLLNFIYTSCTAICPPMTRIFAEVQNRLGPERRRLHMVSVSIDPEHDTPRQLKDYARQFGADDNWIFLTGSSAASASVQKAFNAYRPDKMGHTPLTFLRRAPGQPWVRLDGLAQADRLLAELGPTLAVPKP